MSLFTKKLQSIEYIKLVQKSDQNGLRCLLPTFFFDKVYIARSCCLFSTLFLYSFIPNQNCFHPANNVLLKVRKKKHTKHYYFSNFDHVFCFMLGSINISRQKQVESQQNNIMLFFWLSIAICRLGVMVGRGSFPSLYLKI